MSDSVFTYGTLTVPLVMEALTGKSFHHDRATAAHFERYYVRDTIYPGLIVCAGKSTPGRLYFDIDSASLAVINSFEDDLYQRRQIEVCDSAGRRHQAFVYIVRDEMRNYLTSRVWDEREFLSQHLKSYTDYCRKFLAAYFAGDDSELPVEHF